jgi:hypothetical protein
MNYPKWKYHASKSALVVKDEQAEQDLGLGWHDTPADAALNVIATDEELEARRQALMDQAAELGLQIHHRSGIDKIQAAIDEHQGAQQTTEMPDQE